MLHFASAESRPFSPKTEPLLASLIARLTTQTLVFQFNSDALCAPHDTDTPSDEWLIADPENTPRFFSSTTDQRLQKRFLGFLRSGSLGMYVLRHGEWAAYGWASQPMRSHPPHMPRSAARLGAYWFHYFHTRQNLRGQGILKCLIPRILQLIHTQDPHPLVLADTLPDNLVPQRGLLTSGFTPRGTYTIRSIPVPGLGTLPITGYWNPYAPHPQRS
jgi:hypothetical protein